MHGTRYKQHELDYIREQYEAETPIADIAKALGRKPQGVSNVIYRVLGIHRPRNSFPVQAKSKCWTCSKCYDFKDKTCEWARSFEPVPGWDAEIVERGDYNTAIQGSYNVHACPKYEYHEGMTEWERSAIRVNEEQAPFYNLIAAVYKGMVDEYWELCSIITNKSKGLCEKDAAASRLLYLREFFKDSQALPILERYTYRNDWAMEYLATYQERYKLKRR